MTRPPAEFQRISVSDLLDDGYWQFYCEADEREMRREIWYGRGSFKFEQQAIDRVRSILDDDPYPLVGKFWLVGFVPSHPLGSPDDLAEYFGYDQPPEPGEEPDDDEIKYREDPQGFLQDYIDDELASAPDKIMGQDRSVEPFLAKAKKKTRSGEWVDWPVAVCVVKVS